MIRRINKQQCTGCTSCASICPKQCITMIKDSEGFSYPEIDFSKCIECQLCEQLCPTIQPNILQDNIRVYAVINRDDLVRKESTSGGFFSALAEHFLNKDGYVIGAGYDEQYVVKHMIVNNKNDLSKLREAKYAQSELNDCFIKVKELLNKNQYVLFSGTPCQVGGLKSYLRKDYERLITVDLVCHGVASPLVWEKYVKYRSHHDNNDILPQHIHLRSKVSGWSQYGYSVVFDYTNKQYQIINSQDSFMKAFVSNMCLRPSCYDCPFKGLDRVSDFTLGDYWGIWDQLPDMDDNKGTSLVFVHGIKGHKMFDAVKDHCIYQEVNSQTSIKQNPSVLVSSLRNKNRDTFIEDVKKLDFEEVIQKYNLFEKKSKIDIYGRIVKVIKNLFKTKK